MNAENRPTLRTYFLTGLMALLPLLVTFFVLRILWRFFNALIGPAMESLLGRVVGPELAVTLQQMQAPTLLGLAVILGVILATGMLAQQFLGRTLLGFLDVTFSHIPIANGIYQGVRQVTSAFNPSGPSPFKQVVLVRQKDGGLMALGFLTNRLPASKQHPAGLVLVFVPTNNLYIGTTVAAEPGDVTPLDMCVEQGVRLVVSAGLALPAGDGDGDPQPGAQG
jgi:uncharacterized membrane protein